MHIQNGIADYRTVLLDELADRKGRRPHYSVRAFARDLGVSTTCLSAVLSKKRNLSKKNALRVAEKLSLSPAQTRQLLRQISERKIEEEPSCTELNLEEDIFRMMSDWYYFALLSLARLKGCKSDPHWIARKINISAREAEGAIARLQRLGLLTVSKAGLSRSAQPLRIGSAIPSSAIRRYHKQNLALAEQSLTQDEFSRRSMSAITMAVDSSQLAEANEMILKFQRRLSEFLESETPDEVYTLAIQLFPLTKNEVPNA